MRNYSERWIVDRISCGYGHMVSHKYCYTYIVGYDMGMTQRTNEVRIKELVRKNIEIQSGYRDPEKCSVYARCKPALFSNEFFWANAFFPPITCHT